MTQYVLNERWNMEIFRLHQEICAGANIELKIRKSNMKSYLDIINSIVNIKKVYGRRTLLCIICKKNFKLYLSSDKVINTVNTCKSEHNLSSGKN